MPKFQTIKAFKAISGMCRFPDECSIIVSSIHVMFIYLECGTLWTLCQWTGPSQCLQYIILDLNSGILQWSIMTWQNQLWSTTIIIWPYILIWLTSGLQSWYNLPNVSQNFSNITSDHDVLQQSHPLTSLCHYVHVTHVSGMWHIVNPLSPDRSDESVNFG